MTAPIGFPLGAPATATEALAPAPYPPDFAATIDAFVAGQDRTARKFLGNRDPDLAHVATTADGSLDECRREFETFLADLSEASLPYAPTADEALELTHGRAQPGTAERAEIEARVAKRGRVPAAAVGRLRAEAERTFAAKVTAAVKPLVDRLDAVEARATSFETEDPVTDADRRVAAELHQQLKDLLPADFLPVLATVVRDVGAGRQGVGVLRAILPYLRTEYARAGGSYDHSADLMTLILAAHKLLGAGWGPKVATGRKAQVVRLRNLLDQLARAATQADGKSIYEMIRGQWQALAAEYAA